MVTKFQFQISILAIQLLSYEKHPLLYFHPFEC
uniref:Uncharacterized protein n=1 Tax=Rhizophora mucronata TaxID=61149 RepID=A0A2P2NW94_RHIMU